MIKDLYGGRGINVTPGNTSYPYIDMSKISAGMVRYNGNTQNLEVYDGTYWAVISGYVAQVTLDSDTISVLEWAKSKKAEEEKLQKLIDNYPSVKHAKEQLDILINLVKEEIKE
jgi:hypothetical protein